MSLHSFSSIAENVTNHVTKKMSKIVDARAKQTEMTIQKTVGDHSQASRQQSQFYHGVEMERIDNFEKNSSQRFDIMESMILAITPAKGKSSTDEDDPVPKKVEVVPDDQNSRGTKTTALTETSGPTKTSTSSEIELNIAKDQLKEKEKENKRLAQELRCAEIELKQAKDSNRAFISTPLDKRFRAKPKEQPPTEATAASMAKHSDRILASISTTKQKRSALSDETQTISNPSLRRSIRNLSKGK
eukprot:scaffold37987_cov259-Skeletonema_marinoi.AAC.2